MQDHTWACIEQVNTLLLHVKCELINNNRPVAVYFSCDLAPSV